MSVYDTIIIGGGIMGCSTAVHLARAAPRMKIALLERGLCGAQASGVNFGNVRSNGRPVSQMPLSLRSREIWSRIAELLGGDCEYERTGALKIAFRDEDLAVLEGHVRDARDGFGLAVEMLGGARLRQLFPWVASGAVGARHSLDDGVANPRLVAAAFGTAARRHGVDVRENFAVASVSHGGASFSVVGADGTALVARNLVNCAGAWGNVVASSFGEAVPMQALGPQMGVTEPLPFFILPSTSTVNSPIYLRQVRRGNIVFGGGPRAEVNPDLVRHYSLPENTARHAVLLRSVAPALKSARVIRAWSGIEGYLPDGLPILGPSATTPGLAHGFGFCGSGFQLGPGVGAVLAELVLDGATTTPIAAFDIRRFASAAAQEMRA